jgi:hypothetical protein
MKFMARFEEAGRGADPLLDDAACVLLKGLVFCSRAF